MSISDGLDPYFYCRKMKKTWSMKEEMDGEVFISHQSRHFSFIDKMMKVLFHTCTLIWRVNNYVSRQGKGINRRNESTIFIIIQFVAFRCCTKFDIINCLHFLKPFSLIIRGDYHFCYKKNFNSVFTTDRTFPSVSWQL